MFDPTKHNYVKKLDDLITKGQIPPSALCFIDIYHDDWCRINQGGYCNCDPDIRMCQVPLLDPDRN